MQRKTYPGDKMPGELFFIFEDGITAKDIKRFMNKQKKKLEKNVIKQQEGNTTKGRRKRKNNHNPITALPTKLIKSQTEKQHKNDNDILINITSSGTSKCCCDFESDSGVDVKCSHCPEKKRQNIYDTSSKPPNANKVSMNHIETCKLKNCNSKKSTKRLDRLRRKQFKEKFQKYLSQTNGTDDDAYNELQNVDCNVENVFLQSLTQEKIGTVNKSIEVVTNCNKPSAIVSPDSCDSVNRNCSSYDNISHSNELFIGRNTDTNHTKICFELPENEHDDRSMVVHSTDETNNLNVTILSETYCKCHSNFGQPPSEFVALDCEFVGIGNRKTNALGKNNI